MLLFLIQMVNVQLQTRDKVGTFSVFFIIPIFFVNYFSVVALPFCDLWLLHSLWLWQKMDQITSIQDFNSTIKFYDWEHHTHIYFKYRIINRYSWTENQSCNSALSRNYYTWHISTLTYSIYKFRTFLHHQDLKCDLLRLSVSVSH